MKAGTVAWYGVVGLLPLWIALALVMAGSVGEGSDYWLAAPWLLIAAVPLCAVTLLIVGIARTIHARTEGDVGSKGRRVGFFLGAVAVLVLAGIVMQRVRKADLEAAQQAGQVLVERSAEVARVAPAGARASLRVTRRDAAGNVTQFHYSVRPSGAGEALMAVVDVSGGWRDTRVRLACVVPEPEYAARPSGSEPCPPQHVVAPG